MQFVRIFLLAVFCTLLLTVNQALAASQGMKIYQNSNHNFSIEVPEYMTYFTPKNPNVKMSAGVQGFNMNVIVKPTTVKNSDDYFLSDLLNEQVTKKRRKAPDFSRGDESRNKTCNLSFV